MMTEAEWQRWSRGDRWDGVDTSANLRKLKAQRELETRLGRALTDKEREEFQK